MAATVTRADRRPASLFPAGGMDSSQSSDRAAHDAARSIRHALDHLDADKAVQQGTTLRTTTSDAGYHGFQRTRTVNY